MVPVFLEMLNGVFSMVLQQLPFKTGTGDTFGQERGLL